jgi:acetoin utilization deacetylase AcuC-like enzyme
MNIEKTKVFCSFQDAPEHHFKSHPEAPGRIRALREWLHDPPYSEIQWLNYSPAQEADVLLIHRKQHLERLKYECDQGAHQFEPSPSYVTEASYADALGAVGATLAVSRKILDEGSGNGFAIVRPPGHHAEAEEAMGFCLMNNVAIACADALASGLNKAAVVDFDAHHGNGIQRAFWDTQQVGYFSTHEKNSYPGTGLLESAKHARGRIINVPLPGFSGNDAFLKVFEKLLVPWFRKFKPQMLFVAAGYDAHFSDPLTTLTLDTDGFYLITQRLIALAEEFCEGRLLFVLEGGYDPIALKNNIQASLAAMCGHQKGDDHYGKGPVVSPDVDTLVEKIKILHNL